MKYFSLFIISISGFSQGIHHQMLSAQGKSVVISNGIMVRQTVGQQSDIGNFKNGYTVGQGFQQSNWKKIASKNIDNIISIVTYPNPFTSKINFQFSQQITDKIQIKIFDVSGRLVFKEERIIPQMLLKIDLFHLASSNYLVCLTSSNFTYYSQIFKQE